MTTRWTAAPRRCRSWLFLGFLLSLVSLAVPAFGASSTLESDYGSPAALLLPEISGMGGTGAALYRGGVSNVINPAFLIMEEGMRIDAAVAFEEAHEDRFSPLFDTFTSFVNETAIASNRHGYFGSGFGFARRIDNAHLPMVVALSLTDRYAYGYDFVEELRDPDPFADPRDKVLEDRALEIDGTLRALSGGVAFEMNRIWSIGASVHYAFGSRDEVRTRRLYQVPSNSTSTTSNADLEGVNFILGARLHANERIELGLAYETPLIATGNVSLTEATGFNPVTFTESFDHLSIHYPRRWRFGFAYLPRTEPRTTFSADAVFTEWTKLEDSRMPGDDNPLLLEDTMDVRIGVEHVFHSGFLARFGFRHLDSYTDREAGTSYFTAGVGFPVEGGLISASAELSKTNTFQGHWFPYPAGFVAPDETRVEDTRLRFGMGYTRTF